MFRSDESEVSSSVFSKTFLMHLEQDWHFFLKLWGVFCVRTEKAGVVGLHMGWAGVHVCFHRLSKSLPGEVSPANIISVFPQCCLWDIFIIEEVPHSQATTKIEKTHFRQRITERCGHILNFLLVSIWFYKTICSYWNKCHVCLFFQEQGFPRQRQVSNQLLMIVSAF